MGGLLNLHSLPRGLYLELAPSFQRINRGVLSMSKYTNPPDAAFLICRILSASANPYAALVHSPYLTDAEI